MANPANPLDRYVTYTYHFELHAGTSWDQLKYLEQSDANLSTDRFSANGTLLINTRKDAHQVIDAVKIVATQSRTGGGIGAFVIAGADNQPVEITISEPGGFAFIEKIQRLMEVNEITNLTNFLFVLKIIFVGRTSEIESAPVTEYSKLIPMILTTMRGSFTHIGGTYNLVFVPNVVAATSGSKNTGSQLRFSYIDKAISFEAKTVKEAMQKYEDKLNSIYDNTYANKLDSRASKKIKYKIICDDRLNGDVKGVTNSNFSAESPTQFRFDPKVEISNHLTQILLRSPDVVSKIAKSNGTYKKEFHPDAFMPIIIPRVYPRDDYIEVIFDIKLYEGGSSNRFTFDFYFADPGKNVDVMDYEVVFDTMTSYLAYHSTTSLDKNTNMTGQMQTANKKAYQLDLIHIDVTKKKLEANEPEKATVLNLKSNDIAPPLTRSNSDANAFNDYAYKNVVESKIALSTVSEFVSAGGRNQQTFTIRGHLDLLNLCCAYPDGSFDPTLAVEGVWVKVNIRMPLGDTGRYIPFYYTGWYELVTITNIFENGKFIQQLSVTASEMAERQGIK